MKGALTASSANGIWALALAGAMWAATPVWPVGAVDQPLPDSETALLAMIDVDPSAPLPHKALALFYIRRGEYAKAIDRYQRVIALVPRDIDARLHLAELYGWTGDFDHSIVHFKDLLALNPENLQAKLGLAQVFRWSHRYTDAERLYEEILAVEPDRLDAIKGMAKTHALAGDFPKSVAFWDKGIALFPGDPELYIEKATVLAWQGQLKEAVSLVQKALALAPASAHAYRTLGDVYTWKREFGRAAESYRHAQALGPYSVDTALDLAAAYQAAGDAAQAEEVVKEALRHSPNHRRALERLQEIRRGPPAEPSRVIETVFEPFVYTGTLALLTWVFYRNRRLVRYGSTLYRLFYRAIFPGLIVLSIGAFVARYVFVVSIFEELFEPLLFATLGLAVFLLFWERRTTTALTTDAVLVVGAHPDDIELGAGGFLLRLKDEGAQVYGLVLSEGEQGTPEPVSRRRAEAEAAAAALGLDGIWVLDFPDAQLRDHVAAMKKAIEEKIEEHRIRLVVTHSPKETHGDHLAVFEATKEASRRCSLFCFESISSPQEFVPNFFVDITAYLPEKLRVLGLHKTQREKLYMDPEMVKGRAAHRGLQAGIPYAEAFWVYRWVR